MEDKINRYKVQGSAPRSGEKARGISNHACKLGSTPFTRGKGVEMSNGGFLPGDNLAYARKRISAGERNRCLWITPSYAKKCSLREIR